MDLMAVLSLPADVQRHRGFRVDGMNNPSPRAVADDDEQDRGGEETTVPRVLGSIQQDR